MYNSENFIALNDFLYSETEISNIIEFGKIMNSYFHKNQLSSINSTKYLQVPKWISMDSSITKTSSLSEDLNFDKTNTFDEAFLKRKDNILLSEGLSVAIKIEPTNIKKDTTENIEYYEKKLLKIIKNDNYENGLVSDIEQYMIAEKDKYNLETVKKAAMNIFYKFFTKDRNIIEGILNLLSSRSYEEMSPEGPIMCCALLQHQDIYLRDLAIQTFKKWDSKKALSFLDGLQCDQKWLQEYLNRVKDYLKKHGRY